MTLPKQHLGRKSESNDWRY